MTGPGRPGRAARAAAGLAAAALAAAALAGCGAQVEPGYRGEPLVTLTGAVAASPATASPPVEAALLWQRGLALSTAGQVLGARAPVDGAAGGFTLTLYQPPPEEVRLALAPGEPRLARATAAAVPLGITAPAASGLGSAAGPATPPSYGIDPAHWLVWLEADAAAGSLTAWWLGGPLPAGFHLVAVAPFAPACLDAAALAACQGEATAAGAPDAPAASALCLAPYRLAAAPPGAALLLLPGTTGLGAPAGCP
jgi:hypothetical protein